MILQTLSQVQSALTLAREIARGLTQGVKTLNLEEHMDKVMREEVSGCLRQVNLRQTLQAFYMIAYLQYESLVMTKVK